MEPWRESWRKIAPVLPKRGLEALRLGLATNDPRIDKKRWLYFDSTQENGIYVNNACAIGYCFWKNGESEKPGEVQRRVNGFTSNEQYVNDVADFIRWFDGSSKGLTFPLLLEEVELELQNRRVAALAKQEKVTVDLTPYKDVLMERPELMVKS